MQLSVSEMNFWLGILRDHTIFIHDNLGPSEKDSIQKSKQLCYTFENLINNAGTVTADQAIQATEELIQFKQCLLQRQLNCRITLHLAPSDINQMINEAQEFLRVLGRMPAPPPEPLARLFHYLHLWVYDAAAHSSMLYRMLDPNEAGLLKELHFYEKRFNQLFLHSISKKQMYHKLMQGFPSINGLVVNIRDVFKLHLGLLQSLEQKFGACTVQNNGPPLAPNHMIREESYFLNQLAIVTTQLSL